MILDDMCPNCQGPVSEHTENEAKECIIALGYVPGEEFDR